MKRLLAIALLGTLAGCVEQTDPLAEAQAAPVAAAVVNVTDTRDVPPGDFSVSVTVFNPSSRPNTPPFRRPARYILAPDWVLRVAIGPGCTEQTYPPAIRTLRAAEVEEVWKLVRDAGLTTEGTPGRIATTADFHAPDRGTSYLVSTRADEVRRSFAYDPGNPATRRLIEKLASLSWNAQ